MRRSKKRIQSLFDNVVESGLEPHARTDPDLYRLIAQRAGVRPERLIYVDVERDYLAAAASAGVRHTILGTCPVLTGLSLTARHAPLPPHCVGSTQVKRPVSFTDAGQLCT
jgi:FMN phosphatase YigB (HAD superfamily)